jgi:hypothetical protein
MNIDTQQQQSPRVIALTQYIYSCLYEAIYGSNSGSGAQADGGKGEGDCALATVTS